MLSTDASFLEDATQLQEMIGAFRLWWRNGGKSFMSFYICLNSAILKSQIAEISEYIVHFKFSVDLMEVLGINDEQWLINKFLIKVATNQAWAY